MKRCDCCSISQADIAHELKTFDVVAVLQGRDVIVTLTVCASCKDTLVEAKEAALKKAEMKDETPRV